MIFVYNTLFFQFPDLSRDLVVSEIERTRDFLKEVESQLEKNKPSKKSYISCELSFKILREN